MSLNPDPSTSRGAAAARTAAELASADVRQTADTLLSDDDLSRMLGLLEGWAVADGHLSRVFALTDYHGTMAFVNAVAWIAHRGDHHPDLQVGYNRCTVRWSTHSAGGLTLKDLICAAQVDALQCPTA